MSGYAALTRPTAINQHGEGFVSLLLTFCPKFKRHVNISRKRGQHGPIRGQGSLNIVDHRLCVDYGIDNPHQFFRFQKPADLALRIIQIAKGSRFGRACFHTGRKFAALEAVQAKIAFIRQTGVRIAVTGAVRAGADAIGASDALVWNNHNQAMGIVPTLILCGYIIPSAQSQLPDKALTIAYERRIWVAGFRFLCRSHSAILSFSVANFSNPKNNT